MQISITHGQMVQRVRAVMTRLARRYYTESEAENDPEALVSTYKKPTASEKTVTGEVLTTQPKGWMKPVATGTV